MTTVRLLRVFNSAWTIVDTQSSHLIGKVIRLDSESWEARYYPPASPTILRTGATRDEAVRRLARSLGWKVAP